MNQAAIREDGGTVLGQQLFFPRINGDQRLVTLIHLDHSYSKPWNWRSETTNCFPTRTLLVPRLTRNVNPMAVDNTDEYINVEQDPCKSTPSYDPQQARKVMSECERFVSFANPWLEDEEEEEMTGWEEQVVKDGWTQQQSKLYREIIKVLHQDRLSRLAQEGVDSEPVLRRITVDKSARRARAVLASHPTLWDTRQVQWLHAVLVDNLPRPYLAAWLDILQTLRSKMPALVERMLAGANHTAQESRIHQLSMEGLSLLLKRSWDPAVSTAFQRLKKLPGNPVIIVAPPGPADPRPISRRMRLWNNQLGCLGKVIVINMPTPRGENSYRTPVTQFLFQMVTATLAKVREMRQGSSDRPLILMGWGTGAAIAAHVAGLEKLSGLVCLGFPMTTVSGIRGQMGDALLDIRTPTLFVVGERSTCCRTDDIEDLRERLPVETGLVIVGAADASLRISRRKKRTEAVTQSIVDRAIIDEVRHFLQTILLPQEGVSSCMNSTPSSSSTAGSTPTGSGTTTGFPELTGAGPAGAMPTFVMPRQEGPAGAQSGSPREAVRKVNRSRKRNSSAADAGQNSQGVSGKKGRGGAASSAPSTPVKGVPGAYSIGTGPSGPITMKPAGQKRQRRPKKQPPPAAPSPGLEPLVPPHPQQQSLHHFPGVGNPLPPGLLSISAPLPQATLVPPPGSPPPLPIRVPLSGSTLSPILSSALCSPGLLLPPVSQHLHEKPVLGAGVPRSSPRPLLAAPTFNTKLRLPGPSTSRVIQYAPRNSAPRPPAPPLQPVVLAGKDGSIISATSSPSSWIPEAARGSPDGGISYPSPTHSLPSFRSHSETTPTVVTASSSAGNQSNLLVSAPGAGPTVGVCASEGAAAVLFPGLTGKKPRPVLSSSAGPPPVVSVEAWRSAFCKDSGSTPITSVAAVNDTADTRRPGESRVGAAAAAGLGKMRAATKSSLSIVPALAAAPKTNSDNILSGAQGGHANCPPSSANLSDNS